MSRLTEQELTEILDENKGISMVNPNRVYPPLPPAENIMPLMRIPEQATLCEKIGGTGIYSDRTFPRGRGGTCLGFSAGYSCGTQQITVLIPRVMMRIKKYRKDYRFKALKFDRRRGILYLHFILSCLLSERRKHCKDSRKKSPPCTVV